MIISDEVRINPDEIPDEVYETGCRILKTSVRRFFEMPGVKEDYEKWLVEYEKEQKERSKSYEARQKPTSTCC